MKKLYMILTAFLMAVTVFAQAPKKMSYQAIIRDASNKLVTSSAIGMKISILKGSVTGTAVYVETQKPTSNTNGLVSLEIGTGTKVSGDFSTIDWGNGTYFVKTEADPTGGTSYTITGTSQLLSVPYALHAEKSTTATTVESVANAKFGQSLLTGGGNIELQGNNPFIDFKNSGNDDYDMRLIRYDDNELLLVGGDLKLFSGEYTYQNPKTRYISVPGLNFELAGISQDSEAKLLRNYDGSVYTQDSNPDNGTSRQLTAPLNLPPGAVIKGVKFVVIDNDANYDIKSFIVSSYTASGIAKTVAGVSGTDGTSGKQSSPRTISLSVVESQATIDVNKVYRLMINLEESAEIKLFNVVVEYTIDKL